MNQPPEKHTPEGGRPKFTAWLALAGLAGLAVALFGLRTLDASRRLVRAIRAPDRPQLEWVRSWMTVPYIAREFGVPEAEIFAGLGIAAEGRRDQSLAQLDRELAPGSPGSTLEQVKEILRQKPELLTPVPPQPPWRRKGP